MISSHKLIDSQLDVRTKDDNYKTAQRIMKYNTSKFQGLSITLGRLSFRLTVVP